MNPQPTANSVMDQLTRLAAQAEADGRSSQAARLLYQSARQAVNLGEHQQALDLINRAIQLTTDSRPAERFALLFERERLLGLLGQRAAQLRDLASLEALADALNDDSRRAVVAVRQAEWRAAGGESGTALSMAILALRLGELTGAHAATAAAHHTLGHVLIGLAQYKRADFHLRAALTLATEIGDNTLRADALRRLGVVANDREQFDEALVYYTQAAALYAGAGDRHGQARVLNNQGHVYALRGRLGEARQAWQEAEQLFSHIGDVPGSIRALINLGAFHIDLGQYDDAVTHLNQALKRAEGVQLVPAIAYAALNLGLAIHRQGNHAAAIQRLQQAQQLALQMRARRLQGAVQTALGHALAAQNDLAAAGDAYWQALSIWESLELPNLAAEAKAGLARIAHANSAPTLALGFVDEVLQQIDRDENLDGVESPAAIFLICYRILRQAGDSRAVDLLRRGHALLERRLATIEDTDLRDAMRRSITSHRELLALVPPAT